MKGYSTHLDVFVGGLEDGLVGDFLVIHGGQLPP